jgi:hypothetical protein
MLIAGGSAAGADDFPQRRFPQNALRGVIEFGAPPELVLNGKPARLAPGARIRGINNMLVLSGTLSGTKSAVHYTLDNGGQLRDVWLLREGERANKPWPTTLEQAQQWQFDAGNQTWTKP